jgi:hypothetical protein
MNVLPREIVSIILSYFNEKVFYTRLKKSINLNFNNIATKIISLEKKRLSNKMKKQFNVFDKYEVFLEVDNRGISEEDLTYREYILENSYKKIIINDTLFILLLRTII